MGSYGTNPCIYTVDYEIKIKGANGPEVRTKTIKIGNVPELRGSAHCVCSHSLPKIQQWPHVNIVESRRGWYICSPYYPYRLPVCTTKSLCRQKPQMGGFSTYRCCTFHSLTQIALPGHSQIFQRWRICIAHKGTVLAFGIEAVVE